MNSEIKEINLNINLNNLKSDYFIQKFFGIINRKKSLEIIKNNKNIQKRLNVDINDYINYSKKYSSIVVEIKPFAEKYGKFINITRNDTKYYHIYFDDKKERIKRNFITKEEKVNKIKIIINYKVKSFEKLFSCCECIESINFKVFNRINIINMSFMFARCKALKELNLSNFNTINVITMAGMFDSCSSLTSINLSNFNTRKVNDMNSMFRCCSSLKEINLSNFLIK